MFCILFNQASHTIYTSLISSKKKRAAKKLAALLSIFNKQLPFKQWSITHKVVYFFSYSF